MLVKAMELFERLVVALERKADACEKLAGEYGPIKGMTAAENIKLPEAKGSTIGNEVAEGQEIPPSIAVSQVENDREALKTKLRSLGVVFKDGARTETLKQLIVDAEKAGIAGNEPPPMPETTGEVTKEQIVQALTKVINDHGKEDAFTIIKTIGKAEKLSEVDPSLYGALLEACQNAEVKNA